MHGNIEFFVLYAVIQSSDSVLIDLEFYYPFYCFNA